MSETDPTPSVVPSPDVEQGAEPGVMDPAPLDPNNPNMPERRIGY